MLTESGGHSVDLLIAVVEACDRVGVRLALLGDQESGWTLVHGQVTMGEDQVTARAWRYRQAAFVEREIPGTQAAALIRGDQTLLEDLGTVTIADRQSDTRYQRCESWRDWMGDRIPWPHTTWAIDAINLQKQPPPRELLVGAAGNFASFSDALAAFFHGRSINHNATEPRWLVRHLDRAAYLSSVQIQPDALIAELAGARLQQTRVELTTPLSHQTVEPDADGRVRFALPDGLQASTLLVVRTDDDEFWRDYRHFYNGPHPADPSVTFTQPSTEPADLINGGEGPHTEFKRQIPAPGADARKVMKTVAAFASQDEGGFLLFGVEDDTTITGLNTGRTPDEDRLALTNMIRDTIDPTPDITLEHHELDGKTIILLQVHPGGRLHAFLENNKPTYYKRVGSSTSPMRRHEIEDRITSTSTQPWHRTIGL